jgi:hypothetical protein
VSDRLTSATAPGIAGVADYGRKSRAEMVSQFKRYYRQQLREAEQALAIADEDIVVETFLGPYAMKNREVVR